MAMKVTFWQNFILIDHAQIIFKPWLESII